MRRYPTDLLPSLLPRPQRRINSRRDPSPILPPPFRRSNQPSADRATTTTSTSSKPVSHKEPSRTLWPSTRITLTSTHMLSPTTIFPASARAMISSISAPLRIHSIMISKWISTPTSSLPSSTPRTTNDFIDPSAINDVMSPSPVVPLQTSDVGRLWPGVHQQRAALAKAQAQQKQQQQIIQQQRHTSIGQRGQRSRAKGSHPPTDPLVEEKISQLLNSMRQSSVTTDGDSNDNGNMTHTQRMRKDEEDMDEDERLLASEEGKKLSSKERRQLRNKVSARAFRSRRKGKLSH